MVNRIKISGIFIFTIIVGINIMATFAIIEETSSDKEIINTDVFKFNDVEIRWYLAGSVKIKTNDTIVYIDPNSIPPMSEIADFIIITHAHTPHHSQAEIDKVSDGNTTIIAYTGGYHYTVAPNDTLTFDSVSFEFVPMYNVNKYRPSGILFHPPEDQGFGVIVEFHDNTRIYHAGDTDRIPEMKSIVTDIALLPVSGYAWMTAEEAAGAVEDLKNSSDLSYAIPIHYGYNGYTGSIGSYADAESFSDLANCSVVILDSVDIWYPHEITLPDIISPSSGETVTGLFTIEWTESIDSWGDLIFYTVYYSIDGGSNWIRLESYLSTTIYVWDSSFFDDGTYLIKVEATCFDVTVEDVSDATFTVNNTISTDTSDTSISTTSQTFISAPGLTFQIFFLSMIAILTLKKYRRKRA
ncbi:MAG: MBL fold metallo-hydrolase [Candidatus Hodarchaeales archaeon]